MSIKSYTRGAQRVAVLDGLSLEIQQGEFLALMGPSGSGKTTLLNLIAGIDRPDQGEIVVAGESISSHSSRQLTGWRARHVGLDLPVLQPHAPADRRAECRTARCSSPGCRRRSAAPASPRPCNSWASVTACTHRPAELSGGQQQRVAIARALVADPTLLVCDEPTGDLDRATAEQILDLLQLVNREQGKTIVMVTHDPKAAERATRQLHLDKGQLAGAETRAAA